jgi:hypothetical protein
MSMESDTPVKHSMQQARDILAKWSSSDLFDKISSLPELPAIPSPHFSAAPTPNEQPANETETDSTNEVEPDDTASTKQESDAQEIAVEPTTVAHPAPVAELPESPPTNDSSLPGATESNDSPPTTSRNEDTNAPNIAPARTVSTEHNHEHPFDDAHEPEATNDDSKSGIAPPAQKDSDRPESKSPERQNQKRSVQQRQHQNRKRSTEVSSKGSSAVTKKFRIDTPGDASGHVNPDAAVDAAGGTIKSNSGSGGVRHRIDSGQLVADTVETGSFRARTHGPPRRRYIDEPHDSAVRGPHFQVTAPRRSNITSITGQFLAYAGVLGLTVGTAMVIYGHFGGYSEYTPTGWLVTTVAQMMLFLGVINLVSGGIEQTNDDVSQRINVLGEQLRRIEQVTEEALRGPKIPAHRYANPDAVESESDLVTADDHV